VRARSARWEFGGFIFTVTLGTLLHFAYSLAGRAVWLAPVATVNESVWEHLKLAFWPVVLYAVFQWSTMRPEATRLLPAKAVAAYVGPVVIVVLHYGYRVFVPKSMVWLDILIFVVAAATAHYAAYLVFTALSRQICHATLALVMILILSAAFWHFTFRPPHPPPFRDPVGGGYGWSPSAGAPPPSRALHPSAAKDIGGDGRIDRRLIS